MPNAFVIPRKVGTVKLLGTSDVSVRREPLLSMFSTTGADDNWDGDAVSVMSDRVRQDNSTQNA